MASEHLPAFGGECSPHSLAEVNGKVVLHPPKTQAGRRTVDLPDAVTRALADHIAEFGVGEGGLIFTDSKNGPLRARNWRRRVWYPAVDKTVGRPMEFRWLRNTHITDMLRAGQDPKQVAERVATRR